MDRLSRGRTAPSRPAAARNTRSGDGAAEGEGSPASPPQCQAMRQRRSRSRAHHAAAGPAQSLASNGLGCGAKAPTKMQLQQKARCSIEPPPWAPLAGGQTWPPPSALTAGTGIVQSLTRSPVARAHGTQRPQQQGAALAAAVQRCCPRPRSARSPSTQPTGFPDLGCGKPQRREQRARARRMEFGSGPG